MKHMLILLCCLLLASCVTTLPPEPNWQELSRDPFIEKIGENYVVSDEYVKLAEQRRIYIERVRKYREKKEKSS